MIQISSAQSLDLPAVEDLFHKAVDRDLAATEKTLHVNRLKMWRLYGIGLALIVLGMVLALSLGQIVLEVISIVGSMAVKDAATIQIEHIPEIRFRKRQLEQMRAVPVEYGDAA